MTTHRAAISGTCRLAELREVFLMVNQATARMPTQILVIWKVLNTVFIVTDSDGASKRSRRLRDR